MSCGTGDDISLNASIIIHVGYTHPIAMQKLNCYTCSSCHAPGPCGPQFAFTSRIVAVCDKCIYM